jgi:hypothetical protein
MRAREVSAVAPECHRGDKEVVIIGAVGERTVDFSNGRRPCSGGVKDDGESMLSVPTLARRISASRSVSPARAASTVVAAG